MSRKAAHCGVAGLAAIALAIAGAGEVAAKVPPTTIGATVTGNSSVPYSTLERGPGWARKTRSDLAAPQAERAERRRSLLYFVQVTDFQLADEESPARVEFLDPIGPPFSAAWRPQEAFVPHMVDASLRRINRFTRSPLKARRGQRAKLRLAIATGDLADMSISARMPLQRHLEATVTALGPEFDPALSIIAVIGREMAE